jgi:hypothetical protein
MLRRSERILNERSSMGTIEKLRHLIGVFENIKKNGPKNHRIFILNLLYNTVYNEFYEMRHDIHKSNVEKEENFINLIKTFESREKVLLNELQLEVNVNAKSLKKIIIKTGNKIRKYIDNYNSEKKEAFILLSSRIGSDLVRHIRSYL